MKKEIKKTIKKEVKEKVKTLAEDIAQFADDYVAYQNKMQGLEITDPIVFSHILSGLQKDVLNIYKILLRMEEDKN